MASQDRHIVRKVRAVKLLRGLYGALPCHFDRRRVDKLLRVDGRFPTARFAVFTARSLRPPLRSLSTREPSRF